MTKFRLYMFIFCSNHRKKLVKHANQAHKGALSYTNLVTGETCVDNHITKPANIPLDLQDKLGDAAVVESAKKRGDKSGDVCTPAKGGIPAAGDATSTKAVQSHNVKSSPQRKTQQAKSTATSVKRPSSQTDNADMSPGDTKRLKSASQHRQHDPSPQDHSPQGHLTGSAGHISKNVEANIERIESSGEMSDSFDVDDEIIMINSSLSDGAEAPVAMETVKSGSRWPRVRLSNFMEFSIERLHELLVSNDLHNINY